MTSVLNLVFLDSSRVTIQTETVASQPVRFSNPLAPGELEDIRWYFEIYSTQYTTDVDDRKAREVEQSLPKWGGALFVATLGRFVEDPLFLNFYEQNRTGRVLKIGASHSNILSLPWELLCVPGEGYLFSSPHHISIRRQFSSQKNTNSIEYQPRRTVRILFIVSRPNGTAFIDPRSDAKAILNALRKEGKSRVEIEFLRPATLDMLEERLSNRQLPTIDIIHFDGHGVYDPDGRCFKEANPRYFFTKVPQSVSASSKGIGYLLFENESAIRKLVSGEQIASVLKHQKVRLVVLSACQSAMVTTPLKSSSHESDQSASYGVIGSIAARLTFEGIPAVIAMNYSVLVDTTQALFSAFYRSLVMGNGIGESLDIARSYLLTNQERGNRQRSQGRITLELQDWFLPSLYQVQNDLPLLEKTPEDENQKAVSTEGYALCPDDQNILESDFYGRSREIWIVEKAFSQGKRIVSIVGFGGQGKTVLAKEIGRWLYQTGMFRELCFVDYSSFQGLDAVGLAVSALGDVLGHSISSSDGAGAALRQVPTLIILDNLESLSADSLRTLLDTARSWSSISGCRILITSRSSELYSTDYREHKYLRLEGLGSREYPEDALTYFQEIRKLPPTPTTPEPDRHSLISLFDLLDFHPLSIKVLAHQLKNRYLIEIEKQLERLLTETNESDKDRNLVVSLKLSLSRLSSRVRQRLSRLGVFQGGALENNLLSVIEPETIQYEVQQHLSYIVKKLLRGESISERESRLSPEKYKQLLGESRESLETILNDLNSTSASRSGIESYWAVMRQELIANGLAQIELIPGLDIPYIKFHPTLTPFLWQELSNQEKKDLRERHKDIYSQYSYHLYRRDLRQPEITRLIVKKELPNLLVAVDSALTIGDADRETFVTNVCRFLRSFGLRQDQESLVDRLGHTKKESRRAEYLSYINRGSFLFEKGIYKEAQEVFEQLLAQIVDSPSLEEGTALIFLGRCLSSQRETVLAERFYQESLLVCSKIEKTDDVKRLLLALYGELASIQRDLRDYSGAEQSLRSALDLSQEFDGDASSEATLKSQIGTLALAQDKLEDAEDNLRAALKIFRHLNEPRSQAVVLHKLGEVLQRRQRWNESECSYRKAAFIKERYAMIGGQDGVETTWIAMASLYRDDGREEEAIGWDEKAVEGFKEAGDFNRASAILTNLAIHIQNIGDSAKKVIHLKKARRYAEESLEVSRKLKPEVAKVWKIYVLLSSIHEKQGNFEEARTYRKKAEEALRSQSDRM